MSKKFLTVIAVVLVVFAAIFLISKTALMPDQIAQNDQPATTTPNTNGTTTIPDTTNGTTNPGKTTSPNGRLVVDKLVANSVIASPLTITGTAKGWYFEASFPVKILDANGKVLAQGPAQAQSDWMTADAVPFKITLTFAKPTTATGVIVFANDNPSGLPENADEFRLPVRFAESGAAAQTSFKLFYPNDVKNPNSSNTCVVTASEYVTRSVPVTKTPIQDAINLLIQGNLTSAEKSAGFETSFPNANFKLKGSNLKNGVLTLEFTEVPGFTSGGSCAMSMLKSQIEMTAKQFSGVSSVKIIPETLFQP
jgi:hypothetical protein